MKGLKHSQDTIQKMREAALKRWQCPEHRRRVTVSNRRAWRNPSLQSKHRKSLLRSWKNPQRHAKMSANWKQLWASPAFRAKFTGANNGSWNGGITTNKRGYRFRLNPNHPFATQRGYVREHRLIVERIIGRYLNPTEVVHHLGLTSDNRPEMLICFANDTAHKRFHRNLPVVPHQIIFDGRTVTTM